MTPAERRAARRAAEAQAEASRDIWTCLRRQHSYSRWNFLQFATEAEAQADAKYWLAKGHHSVKVVHGTGC